MNLTRKVAWNTAVQGFGRLLAILVSFASVKILTVNLGPAGYGEYAAILNYVTFFAVLADFGFFWILVKELSVVTDRERTNYITGNIMAFRAIFATIVLACAVIAVYLAPAGSIAILTPAVKWGILVVAIATFWQSMNSTMVAVFQAHFRMEAPVITDIIGRIISLIVLIPFIIWHLNVAWLVSAMVWGGFINFVLNIIAGRKYADFGFKFDFAYWRKIWSECAILGVVSVLALVYFKIDGVMLSIMRSATDVGIYSAPYKVIEIINFFPAIFMGLIFTALAQSWQTDKKRAATLINRSTEAMTLIIFPILIAGIVLAKPIMQFVTSTSYADYSTVTLNILNHHLVFNGVMVLQLLLVAVTIDAFANIYGKGIIAFGSTKLLLWPNVIAVLVNIGLNLYVIPRWSYAGTTFVTIITELIVLIIQIVIIKRYVKMVLPWKMFGRTILATLMMAIVLLPLRDVNALIGLGVGAVVYTAFAWLFGAITPETVQMVFKKNEGEVSTKL
ncbi:MAG: flippase [Patescibacteria group bacterium]|jgi:O-antigen/teichoic acid export membrane protein